MAEHIPNERLAALLDDGVDDDAAREHLASCPACERELDLLRRMRMALSAMDELQPPPGQWERIEARLPAAGAGPPSAPEDGGGRGTERGERRGASPSPAFRLRDIGWLRAAAGIVLFVGGLGLGSLLGPLPGPGFGGGASPSASGEPEGRTPDGAAAAAATGQTTAAGETVDGAGADADTGVAADLAAGVEGGSGDEILRQLEALGSGDLDPREAYRDPRAAAERLARLDALVRAAREALEEDPADPAMNQFLFRVVEQRQRLNQALHLASLDYR